VVVWGQGNGIRWAINLRAIEKLTNSRIKHF
jgi:hypothetical protein